MIVESGPTLQCNCSLDFIPSCNLSSVARLISVIAKALSIEPSSISVILSSVISASLDLKLRKASRLVEDKVGG